MNSLDTANHRDLLGQIHARLPSGDWLIILGFSEEEKAQNREQLETIRMDTLKRLDIVDAVKKWLDE